MRKFILAAVAFALSAPAFAADMAVKAPPIVGYPFAASAIIVRVGCLSPVDGKAFPPNT